MIARDGVEILTCHAIARDAGVCSLQFRCQWSNFAVEWHFDCAHDNAAFSIALMTMKVCAVENHGAN